MKRRSRQRPAYGLALVVFFMFSEACTHAIAPSPFGAPVHRWGHAKPLGGTSLDRFLASREKAARLWQHFEHQQTDSACSLAAATIVINAMGLGGQRPLSQNQVAALDSSGLWREATRQGGPGLDLDPFAMHLMQAFYMLGSRHLAVDAVHASSGSEGEDEAALQVALRAFQQRDDAFLIINAAQNALFAEGDDVGHYVVVGAYDEAEARVLLFDPDRRDMTPFWLSLKYLLAAMRTPSDAPGQLRGFIAIRGAS